MADKGGDRGSKAVITLAGVAAAFVAKKAMTMAWTKAVGHEPPGKAEDPEVALTEAVAWTVLLGVVVAIAKLLAIRFAVRQTSKRDSGASGPS